MRSRVKIKPRSDYMFALSQWPFVGCCECQVSSFEKNSRFLSSLSSFLLLFASLPVHPFASLSP